MSFALRDSVGREGPVTSNEEHKSRSASCGDGNCECVCVSERECKCVFSEHVSYEYLGIDRCSWTFWPLLALSVSLLILTSLPPLNPTVLIEFQCWGRTVLGSYLTYQNSVFWSKLIFLFFRLSCTLILQQRTRKIFSTATSQLQPVGSEKRETRLWKYQQIAQVTLDYVFFTLMCCFPVCLLPREEKEAFSLHCVAGNTSCALNSLIFLFRWITFTEGIVRIIIYPKLKCHPFSAQRCVNGGSGNIFSIHVTVFGFHRGEELDSMPIQWKPIGAMNSNVAQVDNHCAARVVPSKCLEAMGFQLESKSIY